MTPVDIRRQTSTNTDKNTYKTPYKQHTTQYTTHNIYMWVYIGSIYVVYVM